jgi:hypothetical protein
MNLYHDEIKHNQPVIRQSHSFALDMSVFSLIRLYTLVEKRGFYMKIRGERVTCPEDLKFVLQVEIKRYLEI